MNGIKKTYSRGGKDPKLTHQGINEAVEAGKSLKAEDMNFDIMFTSDLLELKRQVV